MEEQRRYKYRYQWKQLSTVYHVIVSIPWIEAHTHQGETVSCYFPYTRHSRIRWERKSRVVRTRRWKSRRRSGEEEEEKEKESREEEEEEW